MPQRLRPTLALTLIASVVAIGLAVAPSAAAGDQRYDPALAVLTATLVALIWYTFFTYWAATREDPSFLSLGLDRTGRAQLNPWIRNPTRRTVHARVTMRVWLDGEREIVQSPFYSGEQRLPLGPEARFGGAVDLYSNFQQCVDAGGAIVAAETELRVMLRVSWTDDLGEEGDTGPRYYQVPYYEDRVSAVVATSRIRDLFPEGASETVASREEEEGPPRSDGFIGPMPGGRGLHRMRNAMRDFRRVRGHTDAFESANKSLRRVVTLGDGYITAEVHPDDLHGALLEWLSAGASAYVEYRRDEQDPSTEVDCSIYLHDPTQLDDPGWSRRWTRIRIIPRERSSVEDLFEAFLLRRQ